MSQKELACQFFSELLASVETLSGISETHGVQTLVDLLYLQNAILDDSFIDVFSEPRSKVLDIIQSLPSASVWMQYVSTH